MQVLLGESVQDGKQVAIKRVYLRGQETGDPSDPVSREAEALRRVCHPNVVALLDLYHEDACLCMVQELAVADLGQLLAACYEPLPRPILKALLQQALRAVAAVHAAGLMHRDIKPCNFLLHPSGNLQLADFGQARPLAAAAVAGPSGADGGAAGDLGRGLYTPTVATRWYRAPELLYGARTYGASVDMWAVGMVAADMIGLAPLVPGTSDIDQLGRLQRTLGSISPETWPEAVHLPDWGKICFDQAPGHPLGQLLPGAPPSALQLLCRMLRYPPYQRPTAKEALAAPYFTEAPAPASNAEVAAFVTAALQLHESTQARAVQGLHQAASALMGSAAVGGPAPLHASCGVPLVAVGFHGGGSDSG